MNSLVTTQFSCTTNLFMFTYLTPVHTCSRDDTIARQSKLNTTEGKKGFGMYANEAVSQELRRYLI
jgi:hypothetical protein